MKVTNNLHLPQAFVKAVSVERHNKKGSVSATTLNKGVKEIILTERYYDDLSVDASDSIWAVFGTAVHSIFEKFEDGNFHEEKIETKVLNTTVTGTVDSYDMKNGIIYDWKTASVYKVMLGDFKDWKQQGLVYAMLLKEQGLDVNKCRFIALLKDHSKSKARTDDSYPQSPVFVYEFDVFEEDIESTKLRVAEKIKLLEESEDKTDEEIPVCTKEERWADDDKFAVMKNGRKTAIRVFGDKTDAENLLATLGAGHFIERRPAQDRKCGDYCICKDFCSYYKNTYKKDEVTK
ncbi:DUF2188 domain-containing protein [Treponema pectinovorum]|uniref:DUF2188 domain-containing protein n=1 Tax=Treponema pectinovorum TaxID=164 RepID=UPI0011CB479F|nr:DUF2188 domain-containing protein [Treponema pectinovorum]